VEESVDYLIIGSGIAGLSFALDAAQHGRVAIVTKKEQAESNTNYAQGGIASVMASDDSFDLHMQDTLEAGAGLCRRDVVELVIREGPHMVRELTDWGVRFTKASPESESFELGREGGHSRDRIVHTDDLTGREIERVLLERIKEVGQIATYENHVAVDLITEPPSDPGPIRCKGAKVLDIQSGQVKRYLSKVTLLATGGAGVIYQHTTNPAIATGDGVAMAYRAGARVANLEFVQFHPTALYGSEREAFLISEAVRGYGGILQDAEGRSFMEQYHRMASLAPRDVVARAIDREMKQTNAPCVYLDVTHKYPDETRRRFPNIYEKCKVLDLDMTRQPIPVVPAAHYMCGGVMTDLRGRTNLANLYAVGEVACTGLHGANRLASNSLLEALVFSKRAQDDASKVPSSGEWAVPPAPVRNQNAPFDNEAWQDLSRYRQEIQELMWVCAGIVRSNSRLQRARDRLESIFCEVEDFYAKSPLSAQLIELRNIATVARLIVQCALSRKESRGLHYTTDYPDRDDEHWLKDTVTQAAGFEGHESWTAEA